MVKNTALQNAFARLNNRGIVAREHWACCNSCGCAEIEDEADPDSIGFVFYHAQDSERAAETGELMLTYGGFNAGYCDSCVAGRIVTELHKGKMKCDWNGDIRTRIEVKLWPRDIVRIQEIIREEEEESERMAYLDDEERADHHFLKKMFDSYRTEVEKIKWAKKVIAPHLIRWATKPGGPIYRVTQRNFERKLRI